MKLPFMTVFLEASGFLRHQAGGIEMSSVKYQFINVSRESCDLLQNPTGREEGT